MTWAHEYHSAGKAFVRMTSFWYLGGPWAGMSCSYSDDVVMKFWEGMVTQLPILGKTHDVAAL